MLEGETVSAADGSVRGPNVGTGSPRSNAPRSGPAPVNFPLLMFGKTTPLSTAGHPGCSVIAWDGTGAGGGFGTLNVSKQLCRAIRTPCRSSPVPAASDGRSGYATPPYTK